MTERRRLIVVVAVCAAAVVIAAVGAAAIGWMADRGETVVTQTPAGEPDDSGEASDSSEEPRSDDDAETEADDPDGDTGQEEATELSQVGDVLPESMGGQEAIDSLGDKLERVAKMNNRTPEELRELLLRDKTVKVSPNGFLLYEDTATPHQSPSE
ncbi:hypothetical protein G1H11_09750 [Phytoactinopolyspora alkaliphila]|uniref:Uncharacterized protein n=1 Tax=Phytoactinopolyspora alkaliphila TaxID=1783498 RepID=A0A6N9YKX0_9ACTN|nr:hypothetical protein [Phytoactinopolyspora alkaliphila]NED95595.1 hypothetical protein [Phytoactinopolyspora alkaliphila]